MLGVKKVRTKSDVKIKVLQVISLGLLLKLEGSQASNVVVGKS